MLTMEYCCPYRICLKGKDRLRIEHPGSAIVKVTRACICGYDGGQVKYVCIPMADIGPTVIPDDLYVDDAVLLTNAFPTGYKAAEMGNSSGGDTALVFSAGPVGILAAKSAWLLGVGRVLLVEHLEYRLQLVERYARCEVVDFKQSARHGREHQEDD